MASFCTTFWRSSPDFGSNNKKTKPSTSRKVQVNKNVSGSPAGRVSKLAAPMARVGAHANHGEVIASRTRPSKRATNKLLTAKANGQETSSRIKVSEYSNPSPTHQNEKLA